MEGNKIIFIDKMKLLIKSDTGGATINYMGKPGGGTLKTGILVGDSTALYAMNHLPRSMPDLRNPRMSATNFGSFAITAVQMGKMMAMGLGGQAVASAMKSFVPPPQKG